MPCIAGLPLPAFRREDAVEARPRCRAPIAWRIRIHAQRKWLAAATWISSCVGRVTDASEVLEARSRTRWFREPHSAGSPAGCCRDATQATSGHAGSRRSPEERGAAPARRPRSRPRRLDRPGAPDEYQSAGSSTGPEGHHCEGDDEWFAECQPGRLLAAAGGLVAGAVPAHRPPPGRYPRSSERVDRGRMSSRDGAESGQRAGARRRRVLGWSLAVLPGGAGEAAAPPVLWTVRRGRPGRCSRSPRRTSRPVSPSPPISVPGDRGNRRCS